MGIALGDVEFVKAATTRMIAGSALTASTSPNLAAPIPNDNAVCKWIQFVNVDDHNIKLLRLLSH